MEEYQTRFHKTVSSIIANYAGDADPSRTGDLIAYNDAILQKLKFQYLEQESKINFLKIILAERPEYVNLDDLVRLKEENTVSKKELDRLKSLADEKIANLENVTKSLQPQSDRLSEQSKHTAALLEKCASLTSQIEELTREPNDFDLTKDDLLIQKLRFLEQDDPETSRDLSVVNSVSDLGTVVTERRTILAALNDDIERIRQSKTDSINSEQQNTVEIKDLEKCHRELMENCAHLEKIREDMSKYPEAQSKMIVMDNMGHYYSGMIKLLDFLTV